MHPLVPFVIDSAGAAPTSHGSTGVYEDIFAIGSGPHELCPLHSAPAAAVTPTLTQATFQPVR